jgi:UPF0042 nucleotide-binding protein
MGYEAVDNLPLFRLGGLMENPRCWRADRHRRRHRTDSAAALKQHTARLGDRHRVAPALSRLQRRHPAAPLQETRRRHPLASDRPVIDGIAQERALLVPLRNIADVAIDTSSCAPAISSDAARHFAASRHRLRCRVISFSYREGLPRKPTWCSMCASCATPIIRTLRLHSG